MKLQSDMLARGPLLELAPHNTSTSVVIPAGVSN